MKAGRRWMGAVAAACTLAVLGAGCEKQLSDEEKTAQSRAELAKRQAALQAKTGAIQALARIPLPPPEERITSPGVKLSARGDAPVRNLLHVPLEQLGSLHGSYSGVMFMTVDMRSPPSWLAGTESVDEVHPRYVASTAAAFENLQYVLIFKTNRYVAPVVGTTTYTPGTYAGEAHLYGVDGRRYGGVSFTATSSETVTPRTKDENQAWVEGDLKDKAWNAMQAAVKKHLPDLEL